MAVGNAIVNTVKFNPLTVAEWAAPLKEYADQHVAAEEILDALETDAAKYERFIRRNPNSPAAIQYNDYINQLEEESSLLSQYGITPERRASLMNLRRTYNKQVKPIRTAIETLDDIEKQYLKDSKKIVIGAPDIDVSYLLEHPNYSVSDYKKSYVLGEDVIKSAKTIFGGLGQYDTTPFQKKEGAFTNIYTPQSYSFNEIQDAFDDNSDNPELISAVNQIKNMYHFDTLPEYDQQLLLYYALQGALSSVKNPKVVTRNIPTGKKGDEEPSVGEVKGYGSQEL